MTAAIRKSVPRIALWVDTSTGWGRRLIGGVMDWSRQNGPWHLWVEPHSLFDRFRLQPGWRVDGVIARVSDESLSAHLQAARLPVVNISMRTLRDGPPFPRVTTDLDAVVTMAMDHFRERGFSHFAYIGPRELLYVREQEQAFVQVLHQNGFTCAKYRARKMAKRSMDWHEQLDHMIPWLQALPKPVGILSWGAIIGRTVIEACERVSIAVPHDVAVLGSDDDELLSQACYPPLSGIVTPSAQIGWEAAALLDRQLKGKGQRIRDLRIAPLRLAHRLSTDTLAVRDPRIARALRYIQEHATDPVSVDDVLKAVPMARRWMERQFQRILGRTPAEEIRRHRIAKARMMLAETNVSMQEIAEACGYSTYNHLTVVFKKTTGMGPAAYRKSARHRSILSEGIRT